MTATDHTWDLHISGVHADCHPPRPGHGTDVPSSCGLAGRVERFHSHSFDGPLVCGCEEWGQ